MAKIAQQELQFFSGEAAIDERKRILQLLNLGLSDMGKIIRRSENNSLDENLEVVEYMDIFQLLNENPSIRKIIFTSSSGKSSAIKWFKDYLAIRSINYQIPKGLRPLKNQIDINGRILEIVLLYSTSARIGASVSFKKLVELFGKEIMSSIE
jgi:G:T/U-mismatch repair DNA glycosylase